MTRREWAVQFTDDTGAGREDVTRAVTAALAAAGFRVRSVTPVDPDPPAPRRGGGGKDAGAVRPAWRFGRPVG